MEPVQLCIHRILTEIGRTAGRAVQQSPGPRPWPKQQKDPAAAPAAVGVGQAAVRPGCVQQLCVLRVARGFTGRTQAGRHDDCAIARREGAGSGIIGKFLPTALAGGDVGFGHGTSVAARRRQTPQASWVDFGQRRAAAWRGAVCALIIARGAAERKYTAAPFTKGALCDKMVAEVREMAWIRRAAEYIHRHGVMYTLRRAGEMLGERLLHSYDRAARLAEPDEAELTRQRENQPPAGLISVAIPVYNTRTAFLQALAESLTGQTYAGWEAVLYDGGSTDAASVAAMDALTDPRIRVIHSDENAGIAGNTNHAIAACRGDYIALCDHDDVLAPDALWHVAAAIAADAPDMIYSDEDKLTEDGRVLTDPHRKPDFCPDNLRSGNYICHLMVIRRTLLADAGGLRPAFDGSQDHDLALRIAERTERICHIPRMLYHWRTVGASMSHQRLAQCQDAAARAVTEHMARIGYPGECAVEQGVLRLRYDIAPGLTLRTIRVPQGQGYAYINREATSATEDVLLILDASVKGLDEEAVREMLMFAQREDVAAVTPQLTDRRGRVTHAGFTVKAGQIVSRNDGLPAHAGGWHGMNRTSHNVVAVSAACMMVRRDRFIPFDEAYQDGLGAVDWCLRQRARGLRCVYTPHARAQCADRRLLAPDADGARFHAAWPELTDECRMGR